MSSVVSDATSTHTSTRAIPPCVGFLSQDRVILAVRGRTTKNMTAINVSVISATTNAPAASAWTTPTTNASRHHAVTSSIAAHVKATAPSFVRVMRRSDRMRASTGNAVIDIAIPRNSAKFVNGTSLVENRGYR